MHLMFVTFIIVAAVVAMGFLFVFWLVVSVLRGATRLLFGIPAKPRGRQLNYVSRSLGPVRACERISCRAMNPVQAQFCRRCGQRLQPPQQVPVRRVAML